MSVVGDPGHIGSNVCVEMLENPCLEAAHNGASELLLSLFRGKLVLTQASHLTLEPANLSAEILVITGRVVRVGCVVGMTASPVVRAMVSSSALGEVQPSLRLVVVPPAEEATKNIWLDQVIELVRHGMTDRGARPSGLFAVVLEDGGLENIRKLIRDIVGRADV
eukprot:CAMPEP_0114558556 /NCGR_PEP_ID=MMETSP0114-20121206/10449_1 /TAXON_ID=31324 /ORGANISM="Goniomonas sp, Strain m" /LENGTH=164 /DNA_ID=CAMNT_0001743963 /DNA_START=39 /DNA_END=533 /DNA_ORIENTATION=-